MNIYKIDVAMDVRAYGYVEIAAENIDKAVALATPDFIAENFDSHGYGSDDFDYSSPRDIWLGEFSCEETGEEGHVEIDLPNSHYPGGLAQDAASDMLAALRFAEPYIAEWIDMFDPSDEAAPDVKAARDECRDGLAALRAAIAKAEGKP